MNTDHTSESGHIAPEPPTAKYELSITLLSMTRGGYLLDSEYHKRDEFHVVGGRGTRVLKHTNPEMTPERYDADLDAWWRARKGGEGRG